MSILPGLLAQQAAISLPAYFNELEKTSGGTANNACAISNISIPVDATGGIRVTYPNIAGRGIIGLGTAAQVVNFIALPNIHQLEITLGAVTNTEIRMQNLGSNKGTFTTANDDVWEVRKAANGDLTVLQNSVDVTPSFAFNENTELFFCVGALIQGCQFTDIQMDIGSGYRGGLWTDVSNFTETPV